MNDFPGTVNYWENRYKNKGDSGAGSYGKLAEEKAYVINRFVKANGLKSVIDWGCGDGNQLSLLNFNSYIGTDVSPKALQLCRSKFKPDKSKRFITTRQAEQLIRDRTFDLALSLDVIFHLIEEDTFYQYMSNLFNSSHRYVIIYSSNNPRLIDKANHVLHRRFTDWIEKNVNNWNLINTVKNKYPWDTRKTKDTSFSDFYTYKHS